MKQWLKGCLKRCRKEQLGRRYIKRVEQATVTYDGWIRAQEAGQAAPESCGLQVKQIPYEVCREYAAGSLWEEEAEILLLTGSEGVLSSGALEEVAAFFAAHEQTELLYGDEDVQSPEGIRYTPWLKPDWSPDTLLSRFYFGNCFAVRTALLQQLSMEEWQWIWQEEDETQAFRWMHRLALLLAWRCGGFAPAADAGRNNASRIGHVERVLFHAWRNEELHFATEGLKPEDRQAMEARIGLPIVPDQSGQKAYPGCQCQSGRDSQDEEKKVVRSSGTPEIQLSVIIPSKDQEELLQQCILSFQKAAGDIRYEIIVVDNGSREEIRSRLQPWLEGQGIRYLYEPMPFHFSHMCNLGAEAAGGEVFLFLNNDVEFPEPVEDKNCIPEQLYRKAVQPYTGAVGLKLCYPGSCRIQHAGVVNLRLGPVHKLQFREDDQMYYYGWNRGERNVLAVTGACLTVKKERFWKAGGFPEQLPVAFNDVSLCFSLFEQGWYNVVLQDAVCYHHESLSRGNDDDPAKLKRLLKEKDILYEMHPQMAGYDPFYHRDLQWDILGTDFSFAGEYASAGRQGRLCPAGNLLAQSREDPCLITGIEYAGTILPAQTLEGEQEKSYRIQGYSFVSGSDNACFERRLLLRPEAGGEILTIAPEDRIRRDVEANLPDQEHVALAGFQVTLPAHALAPGEYRLGMYAREIYGGIQLHIWTGRTLVVEE